MRDGPKYGEVVTVESLDNMDSQFGITINIVEYPGTGWAEKDFKPVVSPKRKKKIDQTVDA
jgi:hypothetical protein